MQLLPSRSSLQATSPVAARAWNETEIGTGTAIGSAIGTTLSGRGTDRIGTALRTKGNAHGSSRKQVNGRTGSCAASGTILGAPRPDGVGGAGRFCTVVHHPEARHGTHNHFERSRLKLPRSALACFFMPPAVTADAYAASPLMAAASRYLRQLGGKCKAFVDRWKLQATTSTATQKQKLQQPCESMHACKEEPVRMRYETWQQAGMREQILAWHLEP